MKKRSSSSRPTIGLILDNLFNDYELYIWRKIVTTAEIKDVNLVCFPGGSLNSPLAFHSQRNIIYSLVSKENIDGLIGISSSIGNYSNVNELRDFYKRYASIPFVSIGVPFDDLPSIVVDNARGLNDLISHLIETHGFSKIAFIQGPHNSRDADMRLDVYAKTLERHGIPFEQGLVVPGDFSRSLGAEAVSILIDERKAPFEAIVAANDYSAIGAIQELKKRGIRVPEDIAVTGFDDIAEGRCILPSLSTVHQPYDEIGQTAVDTICMILDNEKADPLTVFSTIPVIRESCGCELFAKIEDLVPKSRSTRIKGRSNRNDKNGIISIISDDIKSRLAGLLDKPEIDRIASELYDAFMKDMQSDSGKHFLLAIESIVVALGNIIDTIHPWFESISDVCRVISDSFKKKADIGKAETIWKQSCVFLGLLGEKMQMFRIVKSDEQSRALLQINSKLLASFDENSLKKTLEEELATLGIKSCFISLYDSISNSMEYSHLYFVINKTGTIVYDAARTDFLSREIIPGGIKKTASRYTGITLPLYFEAEHLGFVLFEFGPQAGTVYEMLSNIISNALKGARLSDQVRRHADNLEITVNERTHNLNTALDTLKNEIEIRHKVEDELSREKELAMVTLASIGDGVITTDTNGTVTYLNSVAESLTGWKNENARGQMIKLVLNVRYNIRQDIVGEQVDIMLGKDRGLKLSGSVILKSRDGREFTIKESISPIRDATNNTVGVVVIIHNVSETEKMTKLINYQTTHDMLTGVYNRVRFKEFLRNMMEEARHDKKEHIFCYIDIDRFKFFNSTLDTIAGDELLRHVSNLLKHGIRQSDVLGRIGGDQFGLLLSSCPLERAKELSEDLRQKISDSDFSWAGTNYKVSVSIGVVLINVFSDDIAGVMSAAHVACNLAKKRGGNRIHIWSPENEDIMRFHSDLFVLPIITRAIEEDRFRLYKQRIHPIGKTPVDAEHYEILIRMLGEDNQIISPAKFIPPAERYNLMPRIDRWVISKLFSSYKVDFNDQPSQLFAKYSVNLSASTLDDDDFLEFLIAKFEEYRIPPFMICFEITETAAISNFTRTNEFIRELKKLGSTFALDDFGSGWASFGYLKYLNIDFLKIDGSFVRDIVHDPIDFVLVETINHIGHVMGLQTIAEFVEDVHILRKLEEIGVNFAQGYGISMPEPF
jgi:diguanylate cyclase (GGDEF)-like protein/PAS domain S-box-containing protein